MPHRDSDSTVWIGYSDFLTTLVILFFVLLVIQMTSGDAALVGRVVGADGGGKAECLVQGVVGEATPREERTDSAGEFLWTFREISDSIPMRVVATCDTLPIRSASTVLYPGATVRLNLNVEPSAPLRDDSTTSIIVLQGDALFGRNEARLSPEGIESVRQVGLRLRPRLESGGILAVQGHTDSVPFPPGSGTDNWRLSVNRAASAAEILRDVRYGVEIPECQLVVMGFGPTRPAEPGNLPRNRRIEFRLLQGADLTGTRTTGC